MPSPVVCRMSPWWTGKSPREDSTSGAFLMVRMQPSQDSIGEWAMSVSCPMSMFDLFHGVVESESAGDHVQLRSLVVRSHCAAVIDTSIKCFYEYYRHQVLTANPSLTPG